MPRRPSPRAIPRLAAVAVAAVALVAALALGSTRVRAAASDWLRPEGAGEYRWGTDLQPVGAVARPRDFYLPDSGYLGRSPADRPEDLEIPGPHPHGERRFMRYVGGQLVDAWVAREGEIDASEFARAGDEEWSGVVLGPAPDGFRAFGDATSWDLGDRTALIWKDRGSDLEILASRAKSSGRYGVERAGPLERGPDGRHRASISGSLKLLLKPVARAISGCLDQSPMPVEGHLTLVFDGRGRPARIKATTDQPTMEVQECWAGAVVDLRGPAGETLEARIFRMR